ncbi:MAG: hypothetical protein ABS80_01440 [Pseudonocardia sp. SCN 72-51]|nr:MAG: hypothetical protein ABS80_01440 [Pseudonocardia sp. SCN 72-51]
MWRLAAGDPDAAFAAAGRVFEDVFVAGRSHAAPLEPHACVVAASDGRIDVWSTHKEPHTLRLLIAEVDGVAPERVFVHLTPIGGDFESKGFAFTEVACYLLAARTGRPVRHTLSYDELLTTTSARHPLRVTLRTAVTDGLLTALDARTDMDGGAFGAVKAAPMVVVPVVHAPLASYGVHHRREVCASYYSNALPGGHVRSPGEFQALFAAESQVDVIAAATGVDPLAFRAASAVDDRVRRVVDELAVVVKGWRDTCEPGTGIGVALTFRDTGSGNARVRVTAGPAGVDVVLTVPDQGAGSYELFRLLAADTLGVDPDVVGVHGLAAGEDPVLTDAGAGASRVTAVAGRAVVEACTQLLRELGPRPDAAAGDWIVARARERGPGPRAGSGGRGGRGRRPLAGARRPGHAQPRRGRRRGPGGPRDRRAQRAAGRRRRRHRAGGQLRRAPRAAGGRVRVRAEPDAHRGPVRRGRHGDDREPGRLQDRLGRRRAAAGRPHAAAPPDHRGPAALGGRAGERGRRARRGQRRGRRDLCLGPRPPDHPRAGARRPAGDPGGHQRGPAADRDISVPLNFGRGTAGSEAGGADRRRCAPTSHQNCPCSRRIRPRHWAAASDRTRSRARSAVALR